MSAGQDGTGWDRMGWDETGRDGRDGTGRDKLAPQRPCGQRDGAAHPTSLTLSTSFGSVLPVQGVLYQPSG